MQPWLSIIDESPETCSHSFRKIAERLMNDFQIRVNDQFYRITECEFYFKSEKHADPYVHGHERQKASNGEWYFHGSGLDITMGNGACYGGILLRGIAAVKPTGNIPTRLDAISGPLNVCRELFNQMGTAFTNDPIHFGLVDISRDPMAANMKTAKVFAAPRIGLNENKPEGTSYWNKPYRFLTFLHLPHKESEKVKKYLTEGRNATLTLEEYRQYYSCEKW